MKKYLSLLFLIISLSQAETINNDILIKLNSQEIKLSEDSKNEDINFYNLNPEVTSNKNFQSCILEENLRKNTFSIYCIHKNLKTYYSNIEGFINPDKNFLSYTTFLTLKDLSIDMKEVK
jgi:hypothetical protein